MRKILLSILVILSSFSIFAADKITDWKGSEMGTKKNPSWLAPLLKNGNDSKVKKEFDIRKDEILFFSVGVGFSLEEAQIDARTKITENVAGKLVAEVLKDNEISSEELENVAFSLANFEDVYEFWQEIDSDGKKIYRYYELKKIRNTRWESVKSRIVKDVMESRKAAELQAETELQAELERQRLEQEQELQQQKELEAQGVFFEPNEDFE